MATRFIFLYIFYFLISYIKCCLIKSLLYYNNKILLNYTISQIVVIIKLVIKYYKYKFKHKKCKFKFSVILCNVTFTFKI